MKNIYAIIPVRLGSVRLKKKNLAILNGKPLLTYAIKAAKKSGVFKKIYLNSESIKLKKYAKNFKIEFYQRNSNLASNTTKTDEVVKDFFDSMPNVDLLAWVGTTTPFQTSLQIKNAVKFFLKKKADTLMLVENKFVHARHKNKALNYKKKNKFSRTQDLPPIQLFTYSLMMWKRKAFLKQYKKTKTGILSGKVVYYSIPGNYGQSTIMIKHKKDFVLADHIMKSKKTFKIKYDS